MWKFEGKERKSSEGRKINFTLLFFLHLYLFLIILVIGIFPSSLIISGILFYASFEEKKQIYEQSNVNICKNLVQYSNWGETEILKRTEILIEEICNIWLCPKVINADETYVDTRTEFDITDEVDVTGRTPCEVEICGGIISVDSWRGFLKNICLQMYEYDAQIFRSLIRHKDFKGRSKRIIGETDKNMRVPQKIAEGIYLEMNLSANEALNYAKLVIDKYEGMEQECSFRLKPI